ncbi:cytochrome o ubiquinol oxidase subunit IV [Paracoccus sp. (in: a-proteobacteria)]|uniref:cytochrome o ubiquinol oxidase subunit IV n=1 Tax=Paracoccus sp. TaxID=267 RepID=UPI003A84EB85
MTARSEYPVHDHDHDDGHAHGSFRSYMNGFVLSVILTVIPFAVVMSGGFESRGTTIAVVVACALVQVLVHAVYFLHLTGSAEEGWTMMSTIFTIIVVAIMISGSLWVMFHLNQNMMPQMDHELQLQQPVGQ